MMLLLDAGMLFPCQQLPPEQLVSVSFPSASQHQGTVAAAKMVAALHLGQGCVVRRCIFLVSFLPSPSPNCNIKQEVYGNPWMGSVLCHDAGVFRVEVLLGLCTGLCLL